MVQLPAAVERVANGPAAGGPASGGAPGWRDEVPTLEGVGVTLRELRPGDGLALLAAMGTGDVSRFISPPPVTVQGFERFIAWAQSERRAGRYVCFAIVPEGTDEAVGLFQVRSLEPEFMTAEWGFALCRERWGTGIFA